MSNMLEDAADALVESLTAYASVSVTYSRGVQSVTFDAVPGSALLSITDTDAERIVHTDRTYFFDPALLILGASVVKPQRGDRITEGSELYEVLAFPGESVWKHEDQYGRLIQVHTKRIKA